MKPKPPILESERLILRPFRKDDLKDLIELKIQNGGIGKINTKKEGREMDKKICFRKWILFGGCFKRRKQSYRPN